VLLLLFGAVGGLGLLGFVRHDDNDDDQEEGEKVKEGREEQEKEENGKKVAEVGKNKNGNGETTSSSPPPPLPPSSSGTGHHPSLLVPQVLACAAFYAFPFLLSANVLVVVGTTVAERVMYLPSLGVCMAYGLCFSGALGDGDHGEGPLAKSWLPFSTLLPFYPSSSSSSSSSSSGFNVDKSGSKKGSPVVVVQSQSSHPWRRRKWLSKKPRCHVTARWLLLVLAVLLPMAQKCLERNFAWTNQVMGVWVGVMCASCVGGRHMLIDAAETAPSEVKVSAHNLA
jgi:hypothetical protein